MITPFHLWLLLLIVIAALLVFADFIVECPA